MTSRPPSWKHDVISKIRFRRSMHIYLKNNRAKFRPFWFERTGPWAFFEDRRPTRTTTRRIRWVAIWDQFLIQKQYSKTEQNNKSCNWQYPLKLPPKKLKKCNKTKTKLKQNGWNNSEIHVFQKYCRIVSGCRRIWQNSFSPFQPIRD